MPITLWCQLPLTMVHGFSANIRCTNRVCSIFSDLIVNIWSSCYLVVIALLPCRRHLLRYHILNCILANPYYWSRWNRMGNLIAARQLHQCSKRNRLEHGLHLVAEVRIRMTRRFGMINSLSSIRIRHHDHVNHLTIPFKSGRSHFGYFTLTTRCPLLHHIKIHYQFAAPIL